MLLPFKFGKASLRRAKSAITEELIRIVNTLKKLIAKTLLYVVLVESDEFLRQMFDLIWTKNVKFAKKTKLGTQFLVRRWPMS